MKEKRSTKNALISSVLVLALSVSMLVGTTFAWFTDSSSAAVNSIKSGGLDVVLERYTGDEANPWEDAENKTLGWIVNGTLASAETQILWEPNCTYSLQSFRVRNNGNLALKYQIAITGIAGSAKLNEAIEWTYQKGTSGAVSLTSQNLISDELLPGEQTEAITITGHMKENAGNEYQDLEIKGIGITVVATQCVDEGEENTPFNPLVTSAEEFTQSLGTGASKIVLGDSLKLTESLSVNKDVTIVGSSFTEITDYPVYVGADNTVTFEGVNFADTTATEKASSVYGSGFKGTIVFDRCTFGDSNWESVQITPKGDATIVFKNCTFTAKKDMKRFIHVEPAGTNDYKLDITIFGCTFEGCDKVNYSASDTVSVIDLDYIASGSKLTLGGCTFKNTDGSEASNAHAYFCQAASGGYARTYDYDTMYAMLTGEVQTVTVP